MIEKEVQPVRENSVDRMKYVFGAIGLDPARVQLVKAERPDGWVVQLTDGRWAYIAGSDDATRFGPSVTMSVYTHEPTYLYSRAVDWRFHTSRVAEERFVTEHGPNWRKTPEGVNIEETASEATIRVAEAGNPPSARGSLRV